MHEELINLALSCKQSGDLLSGKYFCQRAIKQDGNNVQAIGLLAAIENQLGNNEASLALFDKAILLNPVNPFLFNDRGCALLGLGRERAALSDFSEAIRLFPTFSAPYGNIGFIYIKFKQYDHAEKFLRLAISYEPTSAFFHSNLGMTFRFLGRFEEALNCYLHAASLNPSDPEPLYGQGVVFNLIGNIKGAIESYSRAISIDPYHKMSLNNLGGVLAKARRYQEALHVFRKLASLDEKFPEIFSQIGNVLSLLGDSEGAQTSYLKASEFETKSNRVLFNSGIFYLREEKFAKASSLFTRLYDIDRSHPYVCGYLLHSNMQICKWDELDQWLCHIIEGVTNKLSPSHPFPVISCIDDPGIQSSLTGKYIDDEFPGSLGLPEVRIDFSNPIIRIGYFSADFRNHPVMQLMWDVFKLHDRNRFRIYAFALKVEGDDPVQKGLRSDFDEFIDVESLSDFEVAERARQAGIDIAIDLMGFTRNSRTAIFAHRAAPIQINFLGYPGTMGAAYMDYIIADRVVIPETHRQFYTEEVLYLPNCFQPNMRMRAISGKVYTRQSVGLPDSGLVFCSFNNAYKITPTMFACWMRILKGVEGSVLWIALNNETAISNVKAYAKEQGVDPGRLVIAGRTATVEEHLARLPLADLFLDTYPYNAHTTATDAIRMGVPLLTLQGQSFASRVASSVLMTVGLEALVTTTFEGYERLAIELGNAPERLREIRRALALEAPRSSLFNSAQYTKDLEQVFLDVYALQTRKKAESLATPV